MLKDTDLLTAIKINKNGTFTLKFNSGREINIDKLYKDSGRVFEVGVELNLNAEFMDDKELSQIDFSVSAAKVKDKLTGEIEFISLKDLGIDIVKKLTNNKFILSGKNINMIVDELYIKHTFEDKNTNKQANSNQNSNPNLNQNLNTQEIIFYPKPLRIWV